MCDLNNCNPHAGSKPIVSATERRLFLAGATALPLATILAHVDLAHAQASKGKTLTQITSSGRTVSAYFAEAAAKDPPVVILIHEWWDLNDNIKAMAEDIRDKGFHALAIDLFNGAVAKDPKAARANQSGPSRRGQHDHHKLGKLGQGQWQWQGGNIGVVFWRRLEPLGRACQPA